MPLPAELVGLTTAAAEQAMSEPQQLDVEDIQAPSSAQQEVHVSETTVGMVDTGGAGPSTSADPKTESSDTIVVADTDNPAETASGSGQTTMAPSEAANVLMDINRGKATVYSSDEGKHTWY